MISRLLTPVRRRLLDRMVLRPTRHPIDFAPKQRVVLDGPQGVLECFVGRVGKSTDDQDTLCDQASADLLVLKFPGTGGRAERSSLAPAAGFDDVESDIWTWNPPGYGGSGGRPSLQTLGASALTFFDAVVKRYRDSRPTIWLTGNSLGCVIAMYVASQRTSQQSTEHATVDAIVLRNPPPLIDVVKRVARRYPLGWLSDAIPETLCDDMNLMVTSPLVDRPAVLIQSMADDLVPPSIQQKVVDAYGGSMEVIHLEGVNHAGLPDDSQQAMINAAVQKLWRRTAMGSLAPSVSPETQSEK